MPESSFFIWINPERRILVLRSTTKGRYNSFSVVLMVLTSEGWGLLQKLWFDEISPKEAFHLGIQTFQDDHERIIAEYYAN
jgi:hypothetical protein